MRYFGWILVFVLLATSASAITPDGQGQVLWCDAQQGLWGYTLRAYPSDNIMYFNTGSGSGQYGYPSWINGLYASSFAMLYYSYAASSDTEIDPVSAAFLSKHLDGTIGITLNNAGYPIVSCCGSMLSALTITEGPNASSPSSYPGGLLAVQPAALSRQAGQLVTSGPPTFAPPPTPPSPPQDISTMFAHLVQASDLPQPQMSGFSFAMKNKSLVELKINGQSGQVTVAVDAPFTVTAEVHPGACLGQAVEYWIASINRNFGGHVWWLYPDATWHKQDNPQSIGIEPLHDTQPVVIFQGPLASGYTGIWDFVGCADFSAANGLMGNPLICEQVRAIIQ